MNNPMKYKLEKGITITGCDPKPTSDLIIPDAGLALQPSTR